jgi:hypothetical protein
MINHNKVIQFLQNPYILSVIPALLIILLVPVKRVRYALDIDSVSLLSNNYYVRYADIDGDGYSEKIRLGQFENSTFVNIDNHFGEPVNQWNLYGTYDFGIQSTLFISGDSDGDGQHEIVVFTISNDSIFMHVISDYEKDQPVIQNRLIAISGTGIRAPDPFIIPGGMEDLNENGRKEFIFGIGSGFSRYPRAVYAYYLDKDSLVASPESSCFILEISLHDITGDGRREVVINGSATANVSPDKATYHDHSNWLMVLDRDLNFLFEPIEVPGRYQYFRTVVIQDADNTVLAGFHFPGSAGMASVSFYDHQGTILRTQDLPGNPMDVFIQTCQEGRQYIVLQYPDSKFRVYDTWLNKVGLHRPIVNDNQARVFSRRLDYGQGSTCVLIVPDIASGSMHVIDRKMRHPIAATIEKAGHSDMFLSVIDRGDAPQQLFMQAGHYLYIFNYGINPLYGLRFVIYLMIYLGVTGFTAVIRSIQKQQLTRQRDAEKKITELQLSLVRNQLDPHFSLNALNAVLHAVRNQKADVAEDSLMRFANMYRNMLFTAGSVRQTLEKELDFTRDYLELEKLRQTNSFEYIIQVDPGIDQSVLVPKMVIHIYAENAVKHGLSPLKAGGKLVIEVRASEEGLQIIVTDNGVGREQAKKSETVSSGMGLSLMEEFYTLYDKFYNQKISSYIRDLKDEKGEAAGTSVQINIYLHHEQSGNKKLN